MRLRFSRGFACLAAGSALLIALDHGASARAADSADFSRYIAGGDSIAAAFAGGTLFDGQSPGAPVQMQHEGQRESYAALLAAAMNTPFTLPLIPYPGLPGTTLLQHNAGVWEFGPDAFTAIPGTAAGRTDPSAVATIIAVPGQTMHDALTERWGIDPLDLSTIDSLVDLILGLPYAFFGGEPKSQVETAVALAPTFITMEIGNMDALAAATSGDPALLTPYAEFDADTAALYSALGATGAQGAVANIPDVTVLPFFVSQRELKAMVSAAVGRSVSTAELRELLGVGKHDFVTRTPQTLQVDLPAILTGAVAGPLPAGDVLTASEIRTVRRATAHYNRTIFKAAKANDWARVDIRRELNSLAKRGGRFGDYRLTTAYLGGLFGMDGVHPTSTGHGVIATVFIKAINKKYHAGLPLPDMAAIAAADPLAQAGK